MRQPLRRAVIVANDAERAAIEARADLVTAELNVKELDFVTDEARAGQLRGEAQLPRARPPLRQADAAGRGRGRGARRRPRRRGARPTAARSGSTIDGDEHTLGPDDVTLALQPLEGYEVEAEAGHAVALQLELDDELRREGLAREIVHAVQIARKDAGLEITDRIELALGGDEELLEAARAARGLPRRRGARHLGRLRRRRRRRRPTIDGRELQHRSSPGAGLRPSRHSPGDRVASPR